MNYPVARFALGSLLLASLTYAQAAKSDPPAAAVVSPADAHPDSSVQPVTPTAKETSTDSDTFVDPASLLPNMPALPHAKATLIGGTIQRLDRVRDQITLGVYGGGKMKILFDPRTKIYVGFNEAPASYLKVGQRVSLDTILDGNTVLARTIRLKTSASEGETQGVVLDYRSDRGELTVRDAISPTPVKVRINSATRIVQGDRAISTRQLTTDSLVTVKFNSEGEGRDVAREISILALPGSRYTFAGQILNLDLRTGMLVLSSSTDHKTYEIYLDPSVTPAENLRPGAVVTIETSFEGSRYVARNLSVDSQTK
jgi:hypothetical protein